MAKKPVYLASFFVGMQGTDYEKLWDLIDALERQATGDGPVDDDIRLTSVGKFVEAQP